MRQISTPCAQSHLSILQAVGEKGVIGKNFKKDAKLVFDYLESLDNDAAAKLEADLNAGVYEKCACLCVFVCLCACSLCVCVVVCVHV